MLLGSPSLRHQLIAWALPRLRRSRELDSREAERARLERWHSILDRGLPTGLVPRFARRFTLTTHTLAGPAGDLPSYSIEPRGSDPGLTVYHLHGGGFVSPIDPFHVRYAARLASGLGACVVLPDYPLAPEHTWRDSFAALVDDVAERASRGRVVLSGDSAGGGIALAVAIALRDRGGPTADRLLLHAPWVDLTTSTPQTYELDAVDSWLFIGKLEAYAAWWSGDDDPGRPELSPALADLDGLPPALVLCGTRDLLLPGCRLLADRAAASSWELTYLEAPGLIHVFGLLPGIPEARAGWRHTREFLR